MNKIIDSIKKRRSIRNYNNMEVSNEKIDELINTIRWSPSWTNSQCWEIIVIKDSEIKKKLQTTLPSKKNPAKQAITKAPVLLAMCAKTMKSGYYKNIASTKLGDWFMFDLGIITQSLCLTAHSMGLGTVIVGLYDHDKAREIIKVPQEYELTVLIPLGYPEKIGNPPKRRNPKDIVHYDFF